MTSLRSAALLVLCILGLADVSQGAARVELELVTAAEFPQLEVQSWSRLLADLKIASVRIRGGASGDAVQLVTAGSKTAPVYRVTGLLTARGELLLPGGKFTLRDGGRLAEYFRQLQTEGPPGSRKITAFGLTTEQFDELRKDLATPVSFGTKGASREDVLRKIAGELAHQVVLPAGTRESLKEAGELGENLQGVSYGTALACLLRPAGLGLAPRLTAGGKVRLEVRGELVEKDAWPIGMSAEAERRKLLPALFEFSEFEFPKGTPLTEALAAISGKLGAPILLDHNALAELDLELVKATITVPRSRQTPSLLLGKLLRAAHPKLLTETRIDENDKPFLWVTTFRVK